MWYVQNTGLAQIVKIYQKDPTNKAAFELLMQAVKSTNPNFRYIVLDGVKGIRNPDVVKLAQMAALDPAKVIDGSGNTYLDYTDVLRNKAVALLAEESAPTPVGPAAPESIQVSNKVAKAVEGLGTDGTTVDVKEIETKVGDAR